MAEDTPSSVESAQRNTPPSDGLTISSRIAPSDFLTHLPPSDSSTFERADAEAAQAENAQHEQSKVQVDSHGRTLNPRSCVTCRKRKVKCDKVHPCSNCRRAHIDCVFPAPGRAPRKIRKVGEGRDKELLDRLRKLEGVVKGLGFEVPEDEKHSSKEASEQAGTETQSQTNDNGNIDISKILASHERAPSSNGDIESLREVEKEDWKRWMDERQPGRFEHRFGRLVVNEGRSRYINNSFWANLSNEVEDLKGILNQSSDEEDDMSSPSSNPYDTGNHQGWVFGFCSTNVDVLRLHPPPERIKKYWETYKDRVDPLVKVLHVPTIEPMVLEAASHLSTIHKGCEVLLFAIYYGAVTSSSAADCISKFGENRAVLLSRYRFAMEQALARANFLTTEEIVVLQAFVIFLICLRRNDDARVIWTLTGLVVRIAQTIGVHRDGAHFGLQPFEIEIRRRLWWQVCILDTRASEDHGCDPTIIEQSFDTKMPLNINDADITPDMKEFPPERQGCTDMTFCLIRFEVANTFRRINYVPPGPPRGCTEFYMNVTLKDKEKWITECHERLEQRYLKHCDMTVPLFWVTATVARLMMSKMWLMVYHPFQRQDGGASLPEETKEKLFITSLENMEYSILLETESRTMKWGWLFKTYMQWHALAFILSELCHRTTGDLVDRAWIAVEKTRDGRWGMEHPEDTRTGHLWKPLKKLYRKAKDVRQRALAGEAIATQWPLTQQQLYNVESNPIFGKSKRPQVIRAPLSQAQLKRMSDPPTYGSMPTDKHDLFTTGDDTRDSAKQNPDAMDAVNSDTTQPPTPGTMAGILASQAGTMNSAFPNYNAMSSANQLPQMTAPTTQLQGDPDFGQNFFVNTNLNTNGTSNMDFSNLGTTAFDFNNSNARMAPGRVDSIGSDGELDMSVMDTSGDLNWENWDQLVKQFGMDIDGAAGGGAAVDWAGGGNWDLMMNGQNLRMGTGMGGDWFD